VVTPAHDPYVAFLDDAVHRSAAEARERARWDRLADAESTTWQGVLAGFAEARTALVVGAGGTRFRGYLEVVGIDVVVLRASTVGGVSVVALDAVTSVTVTGREHVADIADGAIADRSLFEVLEEVVVAGDEVTVWTRDGARHAGVLRLLGEDVVVLRCGEAIRYLAGTGLVAVMRAG
jgi:hypothetical protein